MQFDWEGFQAYVEMEKQLVKENKPGNDPKFCSLSDAILNIENRLIGIEDALNVLFRRTSGLGKIGW